MVKTDFLHSRGVGGAADEDQPSGEIQQHHGLGVGPVGLGTRLEARHLKDGELRFGSAKSSSAGVMNRLRANRLVPRQL